MNFDDSDDFHRLPMPSDLSKPQPFLPFFLASHKQREITFDSILPVGIADKRNGDFLIEDLPMKFNSSHLRGEARMANEEDHLDKEVNVLALVKDGQRYVFLYDDVSHDELLRTLGRYAEDPELNFSWYDMAALSQKVRRLQAKSSRDDNDNGELRKSA